MQTIVISGVNLTEGGILSILTDCLDALKQLNANRIYNIVVLVHAKELVKDYLNLFDIREFPEAKTSWRKRLQFEFYHSKKLSDELKPDLWFSLHDITPNVNCKYQVVYCHNPSPFYNLPVKDFWLNYKFTLFNLFYGWLYAINIKKNRYVIVQQDWLRKEFLKRYGVNAIVAYPETGVHTNTDQEQTNIRENDFTFIYPALPRIFKNFEVILKAAAHLSKQRSDFKIILTIDGSENIYSRLLLKKYGHISNIAFIGVQPREEVFRLYQLSDCLLFPSKLETWGLPISEAKSFSKPILIADLEYAHESIADYKKARFFTADDFAQLAGLMSLAIDGKLTFDKNTISAPQFPFFNDWSKLLNFLLSEIK